MKRFLLLVTLLSATSAVASPARRGEVREIAPRYVILHAEHTLLPEERAQLAREGVTIVSEAGEKRYVARLRRGAARVNSLAVARIEEISPVSKLRESAREALRSLAPFVRAQIVFHRDVTPERARSVIESLGGKVEGETFAYPSTSRVIVARGVLERLAGVEEVAQVHAARRVIDSHNAVAAQISNVNVVHAAPYDLTGAGVKIAIAEVGNVDANHVEFGGRVTAISGGAPDKHATHVTGTVTASGIRGDAKGMAPGATVFVQVIDDGFLEAKEATFPKYDISGDNNSWGYILGWQYNSSRTHLWEWWGNEDFGAYAFESAGLDKLARRFNTLIVYSSGNDGTDGGPGVPQPGQPPYPHYHQDRSTVYCKSPDGSGNDCPAIPCQQCELTAHPPDGPFGNVSLLAAAKNVVGVGAVGASGTIARFSARGPAADGRVKPDVVAKGTDQMSTFPNNTYGASQGTSMSAPVVTGISALLVEQWRRTFAGTSPRAEAVRGLLIHGAKDLGNEGPDYTYGFGLVDAKASVDTIRADGGVGARIRRAEARQGSTTEFRMTLPSSANGKVTLIWSDPENTPYPETGALVNDLDVEVVDSAGSVILPYVLNPDTPTAAAVRGVNVRDNVEQVVFTTAAGGVYTIRVKGARIASADPQPFYIMTSHDLAGTQVVCSDPFEPNNTQQQAYGRLPSGTTLSSAFCEPSDTDFYRFVVDLAGTATVNVATAATAVRVTMTAGLLSSTRDIAAGSSGSVSLLVPGSGAIAPMTVYVQVQPLGAIGSNPSYTIRATYPTTTPGRTRPVRR